VVRRDVDQHRPAGTGREREALRPETVVAERAPALGLATVDVGERGRVHDQLWRDRHERLHHRVVVADVELGKRERREVVM